MSSLSIEQGELLVKLARKAVENSLNDTENISVPETNWLEEKRGIFVTIHTYPDNNLRGCIGFPLPLYPLKKAVIDAALSAAFSDPRFPPLRKDEVDKVVFEVSVLTPPEEIKFSSPGELLEKIEPFKDGLILEYRGFQGLFLPQVWEQLPEKEEFLSHLCMKAGLMDTECWKREGVKIYRFRAQIFKEDKPHGNVIEVKER